MVCDMKTYLERLDADQMEAVLFAPEPLLVMAGAGSGKTSLLTARIANMIDDGVIPANEMFVSAFTKAAANEMKERIQLLTDCADLEIGTFHSIMFRVLNQERQSAGKDNWEICKPGRQKMWFQKMLEGRSKDYPNALDLACDVGNVMGTIGAWKNACIHHSDGEVKESLDEAPRGSDMYAAATLYPMYEKWLASQEMIDFDDMLLKSYDLFSCNDAALQRVRSTWTAFFIDECQPTGTMVSTPTGVTPIEHLRPGDKVLAYEQRNQRMGKRGNTVNGITGKPFDGELVVVTAGDKVSRYTPNHHCIAVLGPALADKHLVYVMRKGNNYRVGVSASKYGKRKSTAGPIARMKDEGADAVWILRAFDDKSEARMEESYISAKFCIPQERFNAGTSGTATQASLDYFWSRFTEQAPDAQACLSTYGRHIDYPISEWVDGERKHLLYARTSTIRACNLMDGMVVIDGAEVLARSEGQYAADPLALGAKDSAWKTISVASESYAGMVWSLDVDIRHTYVGDGIVTHNCQDTNLVQFKLIELLAPPESNPNITIVGDVRQCQPPGTMVKVVDSPAQSLAGGGRGPTTYREVPIEEVAAGDTVLSYDVARSFLRRSGSKVAAVAERLFIGDLVEVEVDGLESRYTPDHLCIVRYGEALLNKHVLYLMRKGNSYRIGITKGHYRSHGCNGVIGLPQRMSHEKADAAWVLDTFDGEVEARLAEAVTSWRYGIPSLRFHEGTGKGMTQEALDSFWAEMGDLSIPAESCLGMHGRSINYPFCEPGRRLYSKSAALVRACNVLDGSLMLTHAGALTANGKRAARNSWSEISVKRVEYSGTVYSLEVEGDETYVADGIVTHNCLYEFRGARPELLEWFEDKWKASRLDLANNYRSVSTVVVAANKLVNGILDVIDQKSIRGAGAEPTSFSFSDEYDQAIAIAEDVAAKRESGKMGGDIAVLIRTNAQSAALEAAFIKAELPYWCNGGGFFEHMEIGDLVAYLRLTQERTNVALLHRIINRPTRYLGKAFVQAVEENAPKHGGDLVKAMRFTDSYNNRKLSANQRSKAIALADLLESITERDGQQVPPAQAILAILNSTDYMEWLKKNTGMGAADGSREENIDALKKVCWEHPSIKSLLNFIDESTRLQQDSDDSTKILTIHRSKGGEWDTVWVANMHDNSFPHKAAQISGGLLAERRIAYVAFTRAKNELKLAVPLVDEKGVPVGPSRFIAQAGIERPSIDEALNEPLAV